MKNITILYIVRHGESEGNVKGLVQGQTNFPLTEKGILQAQSLADQFSSISFAKIYSSDLLRAKHTAELIGAGRNIDHVLDLRLREQSHGEYENTKGSEYIPHFIKWNEYTDEQRHDYKVAKNGETGREAFERFILFLNEIKANHKGENVLIVTHGGLIRVFLVFLGYASYDTFHGLHNTGYVVAELAGSDIKIREVQGRKEMFRPDLL
ncbi:MAG: histidine phosphatase family protein [Candidatus Roizmanbacteria bacterium]